MTPLRSLLTATALLLATASCGSWDSWSDEAENPVDTTALEIARPGLAVAPIIGVPIDASARLTDRITNAAVSRGVPMATDNRAAGFDYVLEGTASARQTDQGTVLAFAWDLTDADGIRRHRFIDTQLVPTRSPDVAWSAAGEASLTQVASAVANELAGFYAQQAALTGASPITTAALPDAAAATPAPPAPVELTAPVTLHLRSVAGEPRSAPAVLAPALRRAFLDKGANLVAAPEPGVLLVTGSMVVRPSSAGGDMVTLQWDITRSGGAPVGSVMQERLFGPGELETGWAAAGPEAAADAVRAVYALVSPTHDTSGRDTRATAAALKELRGFTSPDTN